MLRYSPTTVLRPKTVREVISALKEFGPAARPVAGNTTLYELSKQGGLADVEKLVDLSQLGLDYIRVDGDGDLRVGACTTFSDLIESPSTEAQPFYCLRETAMKITPPQIRNTGTIGGSACSGIPFYDMPVTLLALGAKMKVVNSEGERVVGIDDFYLDYFVTALGAEDLLVEVQVPDGRNSVASFAKLGRTSVDFAVVNAAVRISLDWAGKSIANARVAVGAVGSTPFRMKKVEETLINRPVSEELLVEAAKVPVEFEPTPSIHASASYKKRVIPVVIRDALRSAFDALPRRRGE